VLSGGTAAFAPSVVENQLPAPVLKGAEVGVRRICQRGRTIIECVHIPVEVEALYSPARVRLEEARNSGATTGHAESAAGKSPWRTRATNQYRTSLLPVGTMRPRAAISRQPPPSRSRICSTAEDRD
jgi:hypothetical protein